MNKILVLLKNFRRKFRVTFHEIHGGKIVWQTFFSPSSIFLFFISLLFINMALAAALVIYTPVFDLIPGYPGAKSREILVENLVRLDSLEKEFTIWNKYRENIVRIMSGADTVPVIVDEKLDSLKNIIAQVEPHSDIDSLFVESMKNNPTAVISERKNEKKVQSVDFFLPIKGVVTRKYDISQDFRGVEITASSEEEPVLAVNNGTITLSLWSPENGYIVQIQHGNGLVTIYKGLSYVIKNQGESVKGAEVIGYVGDSSKAIDKESEKNEKPKDLNINNIDSLMVDKDISTLPSIVIEFWNSGNSVDPSNFIKL
ncbi:MAG: M23 family metallopeptidase [Rikenellaceae bacterium]